MRWEYKIEYFYPPFFKNNFTKALQQLLDTNGIDGWELASTLPGAIFQSRTTALVFKRLIQENWLFLWQDKKILKYLKIWFFWKISSICTFFIEINEFLGIFHRLIFQKNRASVKKYLHHW